MKDQATGQEQTQESRVSTQLKPTVRLCPSERIMGCWKRSLVPESALSPTCWVTLGLSFFISQKVSSPHCRYPWVLCARTLKSTKHLPSARAASHAEI